MEKMERDPRERYVGLVTRIDNEGLFSTPKTARIQLRIAVDIVRQLKGGSARDRIPDLAKWTRDNAGGGLNIDEARLVLGYGLLIDAAGRRGTVIGRVVRTRPVREIRVWITAKKQTANHV